MKNDATRDLHVYWSALRGRRAAPERTDIDPGSIRGLLSDVFLLDLDANAGASFRLAGTRLCTLFGREIKDETFSTLFEERGRAEIERLIVGVAQEEKPLIAGIIAHIKNKVGEDKEGVICELLLLPLRHHGQRAKRMLGMLAASETLPLFMEPISHLSMLTLKVIDEDMAHRAIRTPSFVVGIPHDQIASRHKHLVLINGERGV
jgi:hypothetical protein